MSNAYGLGMNPKWTLPNDDERFYKFMREQNHAFAKRMKMVYFPHTLEEVKIDKGPIEPVGTKTLTQQKRRDFMDLSRTTRTRPAPMSIIRSFEQSHELDAGTIVGESRAKHVVPVRYKAIAEVAKMYPELSQSSLGRIFKRDRTTIIHALRKMGLWKPAETNPFVKEVA